MTFNYCYEIAAFIIISVLTIQFLSKPQFPSSTNTVFKIFLFVSIFSTLFDVLGSVSLLPQFNIPFHFVYLINTIYFILQLFLPVSLALYVLSLLPSATPRSNKYYFIFVIPAFISELILLTTLPLGLVFSIDPDLTYHRGPLSWLTYGCMTIYFIIELVLLYLYRNRISKSQNISLILLTAFIAACAVIQLFLSDTLLTGFGLSVALLIIYFTIQTPEKMLDNLTSVFNASAFRTFLYAAYTSHRHYNILFVSVDGINRINSISGIKAGDNYLQNLVKTFNHGSRVWVFRVSNSTFALVSYSDHLFFKLLKDEEQKTIKSKKDDYNEPQLYGNYLCNAENYSPETILMIIDKITTNIRQKSTKHYFMEVEKNVVDQILRLDIIEAYMKECCATKQGFFLNFQPCYFLSSNSYKSAEVLLRLNHPQLGLVSPNEFIPIAAKAGISSSIDEIVVSLAFKAINDGLLEKAHIDNIHINLTTSTFSSTQTLHMILDKKEEYHVDPSKIIFELTEDSSVDNQIDIIKTYMNILCDYGFRFALDDFGTGYSNICRALSLPFSIIKLDRSLLSSSHEFLLTLISVFRSLPVYIIIEGVETEDQLNLVKNTNIAAIQGFYFAHPMTMDQLFEFLGNQS